MQFTSSLWQTISSVSACNCNALLILSIDSVTVLAETDYKDHQLSTLVPYHTGTCRWPYLACDVVHLTGSHHNTISSILYGLHLLMQDLINVIQQSVAVVELAIDEH